MTEVWSDPLGAICPTFSSSVMRESKSATRSSMASVGFLYGGVPEAGAALFWLTAVTHRSAKVADNCRKRLRRGILMAGDCLLWWFLERACSRVRKYRRRGSV